MIAFGYRFVGINRNDFLFDCDEPSFPQVFVGFEGLQLEARTINWPKTVPLTNGDGVIAADDNRRNLCIFSDQVNSSSILYPDFLKIVRLATEFDSDALLHGAAFTHRRKNSIILGDRKVGKSSVLKALTEDYEAKIVSDDLVRIKDGSLVLGSPFICCSEPVRLSRDVDQHQLGAIDHVFLLRRGRPQNTVIANRNPSFEIKRAAVSSQLNLQFVSSAEFHIFFGRSVSDFLEQMYLFLKKND